MSEQWKVVPVEPTPEMIAAAYAGGHGAGPGADYAAMLAAAPQSPSAFDEMEAFRLAVWNKKDAPAVGHMQGRGAALWGWMARAALAPSPGVDAAEPIAYMSGNGMEALRRFGTCAIVAGPARSAVTDCVHPVYAAPPPAASADEWMAEAERLVCRLEDEAYEVGRGFESEMARFRAALLAHLKARP